MFVAEYQVIVEDNLITPPGSDYTVVLQDIKTVAGAIKRIKNHLVPADAVKCNIYSVTDIHKRDTYRLRHVYPIW